jgi:NAD(P)H dehydrogenase (quinone)
MLKYDAILFGISTAYGNSTASDWRAFWDNTGGIWFRASLFHKAAGAFVSAGTLGSGLENIFITAITAFAHHGMYFIPLGYKHSLPLLGNMGEIHGGTPWGAGTFTVSLFGIHPPRFVINQS